MNWFFVIVAVSCLTLRNAVGATKDGKSGNGTVANQAPKCSCNLKEELDQVKALIETFQSKFLQLNSLNKYQTNQKIMRVITAFPASFLILKENLIF